MYVLQIEMRAMCVYARGTQEAEGEYQTFTLFFFFFVKKSKFDSPSSGPQGVEFS